MSQSGKKFQKTKRFCSYECKLYYTGTSNSIKSLLILDFVLQYVSSTEAAHFQERTLSEVLGDDNLIDDPQAAPFAYISDSQTAQASAPAPVIYSVAQSKVFFLKFFSVQGTSWMKITLICSVLYFLANHKPIGTCINHSWVST